MDDDDTDADAMAMLRMLHGMAETWLRRDAPVADEQRVPRVIPALAELDRPFHKVYCSNPNPRLFRDHFRMDRDVFDLLFEGVREAIPDELRSKREALAVTLDWLGTSSSVRAQETRFNISYSTCHKYRLAGLQAIIRSLRHLIRLPTSVPSTFALKFPFFNQALCAIDGAHFQIQVAKADADRFRSRKGTTTTNVLMASDWDLRVAFVYAGVEGSAQDSTVLGFSGLLEALPPNYYVLADAGYALGPQVLTPYRSTRYHLIEWGEGALRPQNAKEYFNLKHASARNAVERMFGIIKRRFKLMRVVNECELIVSKASIFTCCCVHNFLRTNHPADLAEDLEAGDEERAVADGDAVPGGMGGQDEPIPFDCTSGKAHRDYIAREMWQEYQGFSVKEASTFKSNLWSA